MEIEKLMRDQGATAKVVFGEVAAMISALTASARPELQAVGQHLEHALTGWVRSTEWSAGNAKGAVSCVLVAAG